MTDLELLERYAQHGSREALEELVRRHVAWVHAVAVRRVREPGLADDVTQAVFLVLAQKPPRLRNESAFGAWLFRVACHACSRAIRTEARRRKHEKAFAMEHHESSEQMSQQEWDQLGPHLDEAVSSLSNEDREALLLRFYQQKNYSDVAKVMGVSEEAAKKRVHRAVARLREILTRRGVQVSAIGILTTGLSTFTTPPATAATIQSALAATQGAAAGANALWIAEGGLLMASTGKVATIAGVCAAGLLLAGGAAVVVFRDQPTPTTQPAPQVVEANQPADGVVYIGGHVARTGVYSLSARNISLRSQIIAAGGVDTTQGDYRIELSRKRGASRVSDSILASELFADASKDTLLQPDDEIMVIKMPSVAAATDNWRERFDKVYRLEDGQVLKNIQRPFIPERDAYYAQELTRTRGNRTLPAPDVYVFIWDNEGLKGWGNSFGSQISTVEFLLSFAFRLKRYEFDAPAEFLSRQFSGDWIIKQDTNSGPALDALSQLVKQQGGPSVKFVQKNLMRQAIVATGKYEFHAADQDQANPTIHFYVEDADLARSGGGGAGDLARVFQELGSHLNMPAFLQADSNPEGLSYRTHNVREIRTLPAGEVREEAMRKLLDNVGRQMGLKITIEPREVAVWVAEPVAP